MQVLHKSLTSMLFEHEELTSATWTRAMRDPNVTNYWSHQPEDCHDPVARFLAQKRRDGAQLGTEQHERADMDDPRWVDDRCFNLEQISEIVPPPGEAEPPQVPWPPTNFMGPKFLSDMIDLSVDDCLDILNPRRKNPEDKGPKPDWRGQLPLF